MITEWTDEYGCVRTVQKVETVEMVTYRRSDGAFGDKTVTRAAWEELAGRCARESISNPITDILDKSDLA